MERKAGRKQYLDRGIGLAVLRSTRWWRAQQSAETPLVGQQVRVQRSKNLCALNYLYLAQIKLGQVQ